MTFLPIVERELRVAARAWTTQFRRVLTVALGIAVAAYAYLIAQTAVPALLGFILFSALSWLGFFCCLLWGLGSTADTISAERRNDTLGLLFLTDLKGYDVTLGKLAATSVRSVYALLGLCPILALCLMFGSVSFRQFAQVVMVLAATLFLSQAVALWVSSWFESGRRAAMVSGLILVLMAGGPWVAAIWAGTTGVLRSGVLRGGPEPILAFSPAYAHALAVFSSAPVTRVGFLGSFHWYWASVGVALGVGVLALVLTSRRLPRLCRQGEGWIGRRRFAGDRSRFERGRRDADRARGALLDRSPFAWLAAPHADPARNVWRFLSLTLAGWLGLFVAFPNLWDAMDVVRYILLLLWVHSVLKVWMAFSVTRRLTDDRTSGALELLLCTPLTPGEILAGQGRALVRQFGGPVMVVLAADVVLLMAAVHENWSERAEHVLFFGGHMVWLIADAVAILVYGVWSAVACSHPQQPVRNTVAGILVAPWALFALLLSGYAILEGHNVVRLDMTPAQVMLLMFAIGLVFDAGYLWYAWRRTGRDFRRMAVQRLGLRPRGWWWRGLGSPRSAHRA
ncbi:MAG TPA: hypothetical protein PKM73_21925 [Verrucomicrobiota bacterium]|nr:hypothetical protein [Verrucomicrobiota bacterium]HNU52366.1 hypothetical protein [Verrucomicrobiota bacterium]